VTNPSAGPDSDPAPSSEQPPVASSARQPPERPDKPLARRASAYVAFVVAALAFITLVTIIWSLSWLHGEGYKAAATVGALALGYLCVSLFIGAKDGRLNRVSAFDLSATAVLAVAATVTVVGTLGILAASPKPTLTPTRTPTVSASIGTPGPGTQIACGQDVAGSAKLPGGADVQAVGGSNPAPTGYAVLLGFQFLGSHVTIYHVAKPVAGSSGWQVNGLYIKQGPHTGSVGYLTVSVIRADEANYYLNAYQLEVATAGGPTGSWWDSSVNLLDPLYQSPLETVQLAAPVKFLTPDKPGLCWNPKD
jgi:hypothetical protein